MTSPPATKEGVRGEISRPRVSRLATVSHTPWSHFRWPSSCAITACRQGSLRIDAHIAEKTAFIIV